MLYLLLVYMFISTCVQVHGGTPATMSMSSSDSNFGVSYLFPALCWFDEAKSGQQAVQQMLIPAELSF